MIKKKFIPDKPQRRNSGFRLRCGFRTMETSYGSPSSIKGLNILRDTCKTPNKVIHETLTDYYMLFTDIITPRSRSVRIGINTKQSA